MEKTSTEAEATVAAQKKVAAPPPEKKVILRSSDDEVFEVGLSAASQSVAIKNMIEDGYADGGIFLFQVTGPVLAKVVEYWKMHAEGGGSSEELKKWDAEYANMEKDLRFQVIEAADYLDTQPLLDCLCQAVADTIENMSVEDCREYMGVENDFTPEEEAEVRAKYSWAFENP
ncbi:SKP1-like protein 1A [Phoenix dactylifera]|uniref:SKP1-like protein n=1 Tax=Phoenix dactylifera TaxID=42345 RepID=A0A8B7CFX1_PHODC|nr:SKP1-like protein 1A [Phoenix dactylifera]